VNTPTDLPLQDVHLPPPPNWWPPAPGWWMLAAAGAAVLLWLAWRWRRRARRRRAWERAFALELDGAASDAEVLATLSGLLRRAARRVDPRADRLYGEDWLRLLDGRKRRDFSQGAGRVLLDGGFRRDPGDVDLAALRPLARRRFLELMAGRR
jgi:hypothetical protein